MKFDEIYKGLLRKVLYNTERVQLIIIDVGPSYLCIILNNWTIILCPLSYFTRNLKKACLFMFLFKFCLLLDDIQNLLTLNDILFLVACLSNHA